MFFIYTFLYAVAVLFLLPREFLKRPKGHRINWLSGKLGRMEGGRGGGKETVWVHAVSVGEVLAAAPFIRALEARGVDAVISTVTDTGQQVARSRFPAKRVIYLPFDLPFALKRAARLIKPRAFVLVETELWPNAIRTMRGLGVPVFIVNGRLSEKSAAGYRRLRFFFRRVLKGVALICVQDRVYAERAALMGADERKILVTGNFKFDTDPKGRSAPAWTGRLAGPVMVAGSTHPGEEEFLVGTYEKLRMRFPSLSMVLAPRHPERVPEVESLIRKAGLDYVKSSSLSGDGTAGGGAGRSRNPGDLPGIVVVDTVGELFGIYAKADLAVMGGSFSGRGGQNPLEPACWGRPVLCGPDMSNFPFMEDFFKSGGAAAVERETLFEAAAGLLADEGLRGDMGAKAKRFYLEHSGAVKKTVDAMMDVLGPDTRR